MKLRFGILLLLLSVMTHTNTSWCAVLFETSFEGSTWTHQQTTGDSTCLSGCGIPFGFQAYRDGMSYCSSVGNNNFYMNSGAGYPGTTVPCKSGSNCLTFWTERCAAVNPFEDSDGNIGFWLDSEEEELYIAFWVRYQSTYNYGTAETGQEKLFHVQYNDGTNPWSYFSGTSHNFPCLVGGLYRYTTQQNYYSSPRCTAWDSGNSSARCNVGSPSYCPPYGSCDFEAAYLGTPDAILHDGQWHHVEWRLKMNTGSISSYNSDGVLQFWFDGVLQSGINETTVPWNSTGQYNIRGWKFFSIGGNSRYDPLSTSNAEYWWAVDDLVVSTTYVGTSYTPGGSSPTISTVTGLSITGGSVQ